MRSRLAARKREEKSMSAYKKYHPVSAMEFPRYSGIRTFMRLPHVTDLAEDAELLSFVSTKDLSDDIAGILFSALF